MGDVDMLALDLDLDEPFFGFEGSLDTGVFVPTARYYASMDTLLFLKEDCSYSAEHVGNFLMVLWHPSECRLVGVRLECCSFLFERMMNLCDFGNGNSFPLAQLLCVAFLTEVGEFFGNPQELNRFRRLSALAEEVSKGVEVSINEITRIM